MFEVSGRITVKETGHPVANLVVAIFDGEPTKTLSTGTQTSVVPPTLPLPAPSNATLIATPVATPPVAPTVPELGDSLERIGSVLTDAEGRFRIAYEVEDFQRGDPEKRPDLMVAVLAPEDSHAPGNPRPLPFRDRLLHVSLVPRQDAGRLEAYSIRILRAELDRFGISVDNAINGSRPEHFLKALDSAWAFHAAVRAELQPRLRKEALRKTDVAKKATELFKRVTLRGPTPTGEPLFVSRTNALERAQALAVTRGLERLQQYRGRLRLRVRDADLRELGIEGGAGEPRDIEVDGARLFSVIRRRSGNPSLIRAHAIRELIDACDAAGHSNAVVAPPASPEPPSPAEERLTRDDAEQHILDRVIGQVAELSSVREAELPIRPDIQQIQERVAALTIKSGPADSTAYHDFHVLQLAFKHVWMELFGEDLREQAERLYTQWVEVRQEFGLDVPELDAIQSVNELRDFLSSVGHDRDSYRDLMPVPPLVRDVFGEVTTALWSELSTDQQDEIVRLAEGAVEAPNLKEVGRMLVHQILQNREGALGRLERTLLDIGHRLTEPFAFDVFAPDSYNLGLVLTYRQRWDPVAYQVGDLVGTIPLAPNETRKYTARQTIKRTRSQHELERALSTRAMEASQTLRADSEIVSKASTATNFKTTAAGSFGIGVFDFSGTTEFSLNQSEESARVKKDFREAVQKASEEYKQERLIEITTSSEDVLEQTTSGEITNPNNELTVTYLLFELQQRFRISEHLHRAMPVIFVAQEMPYPHEIDHDWLLAHDWILRRVLLDDSFTPALDYVNAGSAADEFTLEVARANWLAQKALVEKLEASVTGQLAIRDALRGALIKTALGKDLAASSESSTAEDVGAALLTGGLSLLFGGGDERQTDRQEAARKAAETRLQYGEEALADAQSKLKSATEAFTQATRDYSAAIERQTTRRNAVDQLRIHVKQNILYYMQAIWDHEPPDQRFFRLYNKEITWFDPPVVMTLTLDAPSGVDDGGGRVVFDLGRDFAPTAAPDADVFGLTPSLGRMIGTTMTMSADIPRRTRTLVEVADLDHPIGYKGNYIVFPLKEPNYLTSAMLQDFIHDYTSLWDPDDFGNYTTGELTELMRCMWNRPETTAGQRQLLRDVLERRLTAPRTSHDEIIVPTRQLFIEALPGKHPLLEDFKLLHRIEDVRKARADVRAKELESLRLAARLVAGERDDPDVASRVVIDRREPSGDGN